MKPFQRSKIYLFLSLLIASFMGCAEIPDGESDTTFETNTTTTSTTTTTTSTTTTTTSTTTTTVQSTNTDDESSTTESVSELLTWNGNNWNEKKWSSN